MARLRFPLLAVAFVGCLLAFVASLYGQLVVDAGVDQFVVSGTPPAPVTLTGQVRENGSLVYGLAVQWTKLSGPACDFTVTDENRAITTAYFGCPGAYTLRLTASDNPPVPRFVSPIDGASFDKQMPMQVAATDDVRVRTLGIYIDGALLIEIPGVNVFSYSVNIKPGKYRPGPHTLMVKACDSMNLCADNSITIYKR